MNNQYQQPNQPMPQYIPPQKPYVDPAKAKKEKTDAINELGDKIAAALKTNPILAAIEKNSEIYSYIATAACFLLTIVLMTMGSFQIPLGIIAVIFGFFAISKKKVLPLTVAMTVFSLFSLVCFINSITRIVDVARYGFYVTALGAAILGMIFSLLELGAVSFLTYIAWTYHLATVPAKPAVQQGYYGQPPQQGQGAQQQGQGAPFAQQAQPISQPAAQQTAQNPAQPIPTPSAVKSAEPVLKPIAPTAPTAPAQDFSVAAANSENTPVSHKFCTSCGTENNAEAVFCKNCGKKF